MTEEERRQAKIEEETSYELMLKQQQLFLQWQLEMQSKVSCHEWSSNSELFKRVTKTSQHLICLVATLEPVLYRPLGLFEFGTPQHLLYYFKAVAKKFTSNCIVSVTCKYFREFPKLRKSG